MSLRERATVEIADVLNESDESDQEYMLNPMFLLEDIDISNLYRKLSQNRSNIHSNRRKKSVTVQTDLDDSNIPPSWLIEGEKLIEELYTGLGNIINSVYYNPESGDKQDAMKRAKIKPSGMKYFTLENGYWRSTLLPSIKIPAGNETTTRNKFLCSDDTKRSLFHLLDVATRLRNVIPNVSNLASLETTASNDKMQQSSNTGSNAESLRELVKSQSRNVKTSYHNIGKSNSVDDLVEIWSDFEESMVCHQENGNVRKLLTKRVRKDSVHEVARKKHVVLDGCGSDEVPGVTVIRYALASRDPNAKSKVVHESRKGHVNAKNSESNFSSGKTYATIRPDSPVKLSVLPSCSKVKSKIPQCDGPRVVASSSKREKLSLYDQENCITSKSNPRNKEKDFIRKNILDLKNKYNRSIPAVIRNYKSDVGAESGGMTKNGHRMKS